jgi:plastocyanin
MRVALLAVCVLASAVAPVHGASVEATVRDEAGKPVEDAVVYVLAVADASRKRPGPATMDQVKQEFVPYVLAVEIGAVVSFPNNDNIRHHVYSFSSPKKFELPLYIGSPAEPVVFDKPGVVALGCNIHDWMVGYVYVLPTPFFARTGDSGKASLDGLPPGPHEVRVWHPRLKAATETTGQKVTLAEGNSAGVLFTLGLKREWRIPRPLFPRYERGN